jgi:colicin import membrane protein
MSSLTATSPDLSADLRKCFKISAGLHVAIILFFTVKIFIFPSEPLLSERSLRVDLVALPQKQIPNATEAAAPPPTAAAKDLPKKSQPEPKPEPIDEKTVNLNKRTKPEVKKNKQSDAINKLKQMSAFEALAQQDKKERDEKLNKQKQQVFAGNQISKGTDLRGLSQLQHDTYIGQVEVQVRKNWQLPQWLANKKYRTQVRVRIDAQGQISAKEIVKSSGNPSFDDVALETIERASPLPKPPEKLARLLLLEGLTLGFPD